ncbi:MAG: anti-anti-sigma factor [Zetaproteobacteria bacterium CG12_big_fil_rev_8_21_14_0_65_55_1124]|nr:MAG: anti-anti-sigma factor [Zetaproteobacteria bacterium CG1_02_55_237]PIS19612.1 MAG: anti-anti-sigma factor [Zetaproteobacteria bacterium CG08_land_8_20_14_0_20_55_17]PIW42681.1 MAG: anti-anti-sigma factor [Zetaproteobacteria bacterium CG12_big_fil_rev_8_21_14_0_65_55_1124]PIY52020.1 MAG: anti-anti-sigma factor [Zetaproteobacteria bacterium CG_4_10_14_0_8_um_filter_55_43]PIZ38973.1 MAG: anti-anti-sigma factor [Zetaproteobacteria bacterium CG_4_10_14_0_2_um_filter_55_20]PJB80005.1 MAG: an
MKLDISETKHANGAARLVLSGVVNIHTAMALRKQLKPMLNAKQQQIHVDLSGVGFIDSAGLATLVEGLQWSRAAEGRRFVLSGLCDNVRDIFELAKLDTVFDIESQADVA